MYAPDGSKLWSPVPQTSMDMPKSYMSEPSQCSQFILVFTYS